MGQFISIPSGPLSGLSLLCKVSLSGKELNKPTQRNQILAYVHNVIFKTYEPRSDKRDLLAIKVKSEIFTEKERPSHCEHLQKI